MVATRFAKIAAPALVAIGILTAGAVIAEEPAHQATTVRAAAAATVSPATSATPTGSASPGDVTWGGS